MKPLATASIHSLLPPSVLEAIWSGLEPSYGWIFSACVPKVLGLGGVELQDFAAREVVLVAVDDRRDVKSLAGVRVPLKMTLVISSRLMA